MARRKTGIFILAAYLVIYTCLLVPGHLAEVSAHCTWHDDGFNQTRADGNTHDSRTCQICLTGGQLAALWISNSVEVDLHSISPVDFDSVSGIDCLHIDHIAVRAPPLPA